MNKYFEIIITGKQLTWLLIGIVVLIGVAFGLGVGVQWFEPPAPPAREFIVATSPTPVPTVPASQPTEPAVVPTTAPVHPTAPPAVQPPTTTPTVALPLPTKVAVEPPLPAATPVQPSPVSGAHGGRWVQVTALSKRDQADGVRTRVVALGFGANQVLVQATPKGKFRVRVGPFPDAESASRVAARLQAQGFTGAFVVKPGE